MRLVIVMSIEYSHLRHPIFLGEVRRRIDVVSHIYKLIPVTKNWNFDRIKVQATIIINMIKLLIKTIHFLQH